MASDLAGSAALHADLITLWDHIAEPRTLAELGVLASCLALAWALATLLQRRFGGASSIWFGRRIWDGVALPVLALALAFLARGTLMGSGFTLAAFRVVIPILLSLAIIRLTVRVLTVMFPTSESMRLIERSVSWLAWIAVILWLTGVLPLILEQLDGFEVHLGGSTVTLRDLLQGAVSAAITMLLALWVSAALEARLMQGATGARLSVRKIAANGVRVVLILLGLLLALAMAGIDLTALSVLGGGIGVGIGLGLQRLAANYVSGFVILAEQALRIGDVVKVDGFEGRITDIHTRYTLVQGGSGRESIIPNELLLTQRVENCTLANANMLLQTVFQVPFGTDVERLLVPVVATAQAVARVLPDPGPKAYLSNFTADGLEITLLYWVANGDQGSLAVRSEVNCALLATLAKLGVEMPIPQRMLHHRGGVPAAGQDAAPA